MHGACIWSYARSHMHARCSNVVLHQIIHACLVPVLQVATDTRLWLYKELCQIREALHELITVTTARAEQECDVLMPGA